MCVDYPLSYVRTHRYRTMAGTLYDPVGYWYIKREALDQTRSFHFCKM